MSQQLRDHQALDICESAMSGRVIDRNHVNFLRRTFELLSDDRKETVCEVDLAIRTGYIIIHEDGDGVFDEWGNRVSYK